MSRFAVLLLISLLAGCAGRPLENVPLVWKPTSSLGAAGHIDLADVRAAKIRVAPFTDARQTPSLIGENREGAMPLKVTTRDSVAAFVTARVKLLLGHAGLNIVESGETAVVGGEVKQFFVVETSTYVSEVRVAFTVADPAGKIRWTGTSSGSATRFGRSNQPDNYYEVLSDALITAVGTLLGDEGFLKAVAEKP